MYMYSDCSDNKQKENYNFPVIKLSNILTFF